MIGGIKLPACGATCCKNKVILSLTGFFAAEIPFVFEKFYRGKQSTSSAVKGYGLGLNYVKQIMQQHKGWYKLTSNPGRTEIKLAWPL